MAHRHGLAGQYGKNQANTRTKRMLGVIWTVGGYTLCGFGFVVGYFWAHWGPGVALVLMLGLAVVGPLAWRPIARRIDDTARERIKYMRGGQAEGLIAWLLDDLSDDWHVFNGIKLEPQSDIDHVVVGPGGLFCISTKSQRGLFKETADGLLYNGQACPFAKDALGQAMRLKDRLAALMGKDVPWIQPVLAVPFGYVDGNTACGDKVMVVHQEDVTDRISPEGARAKLSQEQIRRLVGVLEMFEKDAARLYRRPEAAPALARD